MKINLTVENKLNIWYQLKNSKYFHWKILELSEIKVYNQRREVENLNKNLSINNLHQLRCNL